MQILRPRPSPAESATLGLDPAGCVLTNLSGDCDAPHNVPISSLPCQRKPTPSHGHRARPGSGHPSEHVLCSTPQVARRFLPTPGPGLGAAPGCTGEPGSERERPAWAHASHTHGTRRTAGPRAGGERMCGWAGPGGFGGHADSRPRHSRQHREEGRRNVAFTGHEESD